MYEAIDVWMCPLHSRIKFSIESLASVGNSRPAVLTRLRVKPDLFKNRYNHPFGQVTFVSYCCCLRTEAVDNRALASFFIDPNQKLSFEIWILDWSVFIPGPAACSFEWWFQKGCFLTEPAPYQLAVYLACNRSISNASSFGQIYGCNFVGYIV